MKVNLQATWLQRVETMMVIDELQGRSPSSGESLLVVLSGTFDIQAGGGSWLARGLRQSPFEARKPVALFLPPDTPYRFALGTGQLLMVTARQAPAGVVKEAAATAQKPLLPLAGSGKAFDGESGTWKRQEDFPDAPEAILPRRIETMPDGLQRIFPVDYKAKTLTLDECLLADGEATRMPESTLPGYPEERAVYYACEDTLRIGDQEVSGEGVLDNLAADCQFTSRGRSYLAFIYAGAKG